MRSPALRYCRIAIFTQFGHGGVDKFSPQADVAVRRSQSYKNRRTHIFCKHLRQLKTDMKERVPAGTESDREWSSICADRRYVRREVGHFCLSGECSVDSSLRNSASIRRFEQCSRIDRPNIKRWQARIMRRPTTSFPLRGNSLGLCLTEMESSRSVSAATRASKGTR
jgi:hypothetical protein